ncbi:MAG: DinB family protein [Bacteroidales bacterium]
MFKSNAVRACVELHEIELRRFYDTWEAFLTSRVPLPKTDDPSYASAETLGGHVLRAARNYLTWIGDCVQRPVADVDRDDDRVSVARKGRQFLEDVLAAWRRNLQALEDAELAPQTFKSRWGDDYSIEQMLEHAVVHPMRHRIQLERLMAEAKRTPSAQVQ